MHFFLFSKGPQLLLHPSIQSASGWKPERDAFPTPTPTPVAAPPRPLHVLFQHWTSCFHRKSHLSSSQTAFKTRTLLIELKTTQKSVFSVIALTKVIHWCVKLSLIETFWIHHEIENVDEMFSSEFFWRRHENWFWLFGSVVSWLWWIPMLTTSYGIAEQT